MAKDIDLTSREWCELVFEGKNKEYGAYELRQSSAKRHNRAALIVLLAAAFISFLPTLLEVVAPERQAEGITEVTTLSKLPPAEVKNNDEIKRTTAPPPPLKSSIKFTAPVIKKDAEVREEDEVKSQDELLTAKGSISIADVKGNDEIHGLDIADVREVAKEEPEVQQPFTVVEQMPQFPGGDAELMRFLNKSTKYPLLAQENGIQGTVTVQFVVSRTGEVTNVKVLRGVDPSCDKEALRVIKSMPRWIPGKQNGVTVPVYYQVPVQFKLI